MTTTQILTEAFTTKDGYLAWRTAWRATYAQISADIRLMREVTRDNCRNPVASCDGKTGHWTRTREWTPAEQVRQDASGAMFERAREAYKLGFKGMSKLAAALMKRRAWSKEEAQKQYQAQHGVPAI